MTTIPGQPSADADLQKLVKFNEAARTRVPVEQIEHILTLLRNLRKRPGMFVGWA
ncbi:MAG: hypothetical protein H7Y38_13260, partial [Armatimonadetes bacterium]|nr:hypothetical protein [Armatimonadota bacterium]